MTESLDSFAARILQRVVGLQAVLISDRDGVQLVKQTKDDYKEESTDNHLATTFAVASEQASKLRMGKNLTITSFFEERVIVHVNHFPLIISMIGDSDLNVGVLLSFVSDIKKLLDPLRSNIKDNE